MVNKLTTNPIVKKLVRTLALFGSLLLMGLLPLGANAAPYTCGPPIMLIIPSPASIDFKDRRIGDSLWYGYFSAKFPDDKTTECSGSFGMPKYDYPPGAIPTGIEQSYQTGIEGLGYRIRLQGVCYFPWPITCSPGDLSLRVAHTLVIELIKTGPVVRNGVWSGVFGRWDFGSIAPSDFLQYSWSAPISVTVRPPVLQCTVTTPQVTVPMGSIPKTAFSGIGSTAGTQPLNIDLMCSGGDPGESKAISVTLTDNTNPANQSTTLSLTPNSIATGIAIQMLQGQTVLGYGPDSNLPGNPGQWSAGNSGMGVFRIPLSARYIQTGATITPGSANGRATFTMSYR